MSGDQLVGEAYTALRRLAEGKLAAERRPQTLQATALVHEVYLRLGGGDEDVKWASRRQYLAAAAEAMRRILIEQARRKMAKKRGGELARTEYSETRIACEIPEDHVLVVDEALLELKASDPETAELITMRFFGGFEMQEIAEALGVSRSTITRHWAYARAWLYERISSD